MCIFDYVLNLCVLLGNKYFFIVIVNVHAKGEGHSAKVKVTGVESNLDQFGAFPDDNSS